MKIIFYFQTGTLTEDGLDMWGVVPVADAESLPPVRLLSQMEPCHMFYGLVTCHSLTIIEGQLSGDPLDLKVSPFDLNFVYRQWIKRNKNVRS